MPVCRPFERQYVWGNPTSYVYECFSHHLWPHGYRAESAGGGDGEVTDVFISASIGVETILFPLFWGWRSKYEVGHVVASCHVDCVDACVFWHDDLGDFVFVVFGEPYDGFPRHVCFPRDSVGVGYPDEVLLLFLLRFGGLRSCAGCECNQCDCDCLIYCSHLLSYYLF